MTAEKRKYPDKLYKYCKKEIYHRFIQQGKLQLGRASYYRRAFEEGAGYGDKFEGARVFKNSSTVTTREYEKNRRLRNNLGGVYPKPWGLVNNGGKINIPPGVQWVQYLGDPFIFSLSAEYSASAHEKWWRNDGYDLCLVMEDVDGFLVCLERAILAQLEVLGRLHAQSFKDLEYSLRAGLVRYQAKIKSITAINDDNLFVKDRKVFGHEKEFRVLASVKPDFFRPYGNDLLQTNDATLSNFFKVHRTLVDE